MTGNLRANGDASAVLTKATLRAAQELGLSDAQLAAALHVRSVMISGLHHGAQLIAPETQAWARATLLLHIHRKLVAFLGSDPASLRTWLLASNSALESSPIGLLVACGGLERVHEYLCAACSGEFS